MGETLNLRMKSVIITIFLVLSGLVGVLDIFEPGIIDVVQGNLIIVDPGGSTNHTTIQAAIDNASSGNTIHVWAGMYNENLIINKSITLIGNGSSNTTIDGNFIDNVINVSVDWVTINGFKITNSTLFTNKAGIKFNNSHNCVIENCNFTNNEIGINISNSSEIRIKNNTFYANYDDGISTWVSQSLYFQNNSIKFNGGSGLRLERSDYCGIKYNEFFDNNQYGFFYDSGLYLRLSYNNVIINNSFNDDYGWGIKLYNSISNIISYNLCLNTGSGIDLSFSDFNIIINNNCSSNGYGIYTYASHNNSIKSNILRFNSEGIYTLGSDHNSMENNKCDANYGYGIYVLGADYNLIANNSCCNSMIDDGIAVRQGDQNLILNNTCNLNSNKGISLTESNNNTVEGNIVENNYVGITIFTTYFMDFIYNNTIRSNNLIENIYGLAFDSYTNNNSVYHNNFFDNSYQAYDTGNNLWNNSLQEGNYWSDYTGLDNGNGSRPMGDGIGDTEIPHLDLDNYPFISPNGWLTPGLVHLSGPKDVCYLHSFNVTWVRTRNAIKYLLQEDENSNFNSPTKVYEGTNLFIQLQDKAPGTHYYRLKVYFDQTESDWSNIVEVTVHGPPKIPSNIKTTPYNGGNALIITWDINNDMTKEYYLYQKVKAVWELIDIIPHPTNTYNHTGLVDLQKYSYSIRAKDTWGQFSGYSGEVSGIPQDSEPPQPPINLKITMLSHDSIRLKWGANPNNNDVEGYNIYRGKTEDSVDVIDPVNGDQLVKDLNYIDSTLVELTTYYYRISAVDEVPNESKLSDLVSGITALGPHPPEINKKPISVTIQEDSSDTSVDIFTWFSDINGDRLTFRFDENENVDVYISEQTGKIQIEPKKDWNGQTEIKFYANDTLFEISDTLTVIVTAVNDPPKNARILSPMDGAYFDISENINFTGACDDPDLTSGDSLIFEWYSDKDHRLGFGSTLSGIQLSEGAHVITLKVSDGFELNTSVSINIKVVSNEAFNEKDGDDKGFYIDFGFLLIIILIIALIIISLIMLILVRKGWTYEDFDDNDTIMDHGRLETGRTDLTTNIDDELDDELDFGVQDGDVVDLVYDETTGEVMETEDSETVRWLEPELDDVAVDEMAIDWDVEEDEFEEDFEISELVE